MHTCTATWNDILSYLGKEVAHVFMHLRKKSRKKNVDGTIIRLKYKNYGTLPPEYIRAQLNKAPVCMLGKNNMIVFQTAKKRTHHVQHYVVFIVTADI